MIAFPSYQMAEPLSVNNNSQALTYWVLLLDNYRDNGFSSFPLLFCSLAIGSMLAWVGLRLLLRAGVAPGRAWGLLSLLASLVLGTLLGVLPASSFSLLTTAAALGLSILLCSGIWRLKRGVPTTLPGRLALLAWPSLPCS